jgi:hypothetical protein
LPATPAFKKKDTDSKCGGEARWEQKIMVDEWDAVVLKPWVTTIATLQNAPSLKCIMSHVNFRPDKLDIGPAFNWEKIP